MKGEHRLTAIDPTMLESSFYNLSELEEALRKNARYNIDTTLEGSVPINPEMGIPINRYILRRFEQHPPDVLWPTIGRRLGFLTNMDASVARSGHKPVCNICTINAHA